MNTTTATASNTTEAAPVLTWQERRAIEAQKIEAARAVFFAEAAKVCAELNNADPEAKTGAKWQLLQTPFDSEMVSHWDGGKHAQFFRNTTPEAVANYCKDHGGEVISLRPVFCKAGKLEARGDFSGLNDYRPHERQAHAIGCSEGKAPRLIAADIVRRLLDAYRAELKTSRENKARTEARREGAEAFARELCQKSRGGFVYNTDQDEKSTQRKAHLYRKTKNAAPGSYSLSGDLTAYADGTAQIKLENVPPALAAKICELIGAEIE